MLLSARKHEEEHFTADRIKDEKKKRNVLE